MSTPRVSVIMPVFNTERFIAASIESVLAQTFADFELILVDDGSTDRSREIIQSYRDPRVRAFRNPQNLGAAGAKNHALQHAQSEVLAFLDSDDLADQTRLARQISFLGRNPDIHILATQIEVIDENGTVIERPCRVSRVSAEIPATLLFENCIAQSSVMVRKSILPTSPFRAEFEPAEDYDLWARLVTKARFAQMNETLVKYRIQASGVSVRRADQMKQSVRAVRAEQLRRLGIEPEIELHSRISKWPLDASADQLNQAEAWLLALCDANDRSQIYDRTAFRKVLSEYWFRLCRDSWLLGLPTWTTFHKSPLNRTSLRQKYVLLRRILPQIFRCR